MLVHLYEIIYNKSKVNGRTVAKQDLCCGFLFDTKIECMFEKMLGNNLENRYHISIMKKGSECFVRSSCRVRERFAPN